MGGDGGKRAVTAVATGGVSEWVRAGDKLLNPEGPGTSFAGSGARFARARALRADATSAGAQSLITSQKSNEGL
jgi:hypothetical protein